MRQHTKLVKNRDSCQSPAKACSVSEVKETRPPHFHPSPSPPLYRLPRTSCCPRKGRLVHTRSDKAAFQLSGCGPNLAQPGLGLVGVTTVLDGGGVGACCFWACSLVRVLEGLRLRGTTSCCTLDPLLHARPPVARATIQVVVRAKQSYSEAAAPASKSAQVELAASQWIREGAV